MDTYLNHYSVLNKEVINYFKEASLESNNCLFADLTFGAGGHSIGILRAIENSYLIAFDQDPEAYKNGIEILKENNFEKKSILHHANFENFSSFCDDKKGKFTGIVADLGVSSHHFDKGERGFSFRYDAHLDMRMNVSSQENPTAADLLKELEEKEIARILGVYGEEKWASRIAQRICESRLNGNFIDTTKKLEDLVFHCYPKNERFGKTNPATKTFQALRIAVNRELEVIENVIPKLLEGLEIGGLLAIISFHSLEDRLVKNLFKEALGKETPYEILTKKPQLPTKEEIFENSRSRSAKLRVIKRVELKKSKNKYQHFSKKES